MSIRNPPNINRVDPEKRRELDALVDKSIETVKNMTALEKARLIWDQTVSWVYGNRSLKDERYTREQAYIDPYFAITPAPAPTPAPTPTDRRPK
jgi:hypothetical protein